MNKWTRIVAVASLTLTFGLVDAACQADAGEVAKRVERRLATTTTTTWEPPTTTTEAWSDSTFSEGDVISALKDAVPALDSLPADMIREKLLGTVCEQLDLTDGDFSEVGDNIVEASASNFEFDYGDAGAITASAVALECPEWLDDAQQWANS